MNAPYFSVITPSWNQGRFLAGCIDSVLAQQRSDVEHYVIDNCSTDETADVLRAYPHVSAIVERDRGQSEALNKGFARARGEVLAWLNADDRYLPGAFARVASAFADPSVQIVFGHVLVRDEVAGNEYLKRAMYRGRQAFLDWSGLKLHQPAIFFRRRVLQEVGPLREDLHYVMDMELWWRMAARYAFYPIDQPLAIQVYHHGCKSIRCSERFIEERKRVFGPLLWREPGGWRLWARRQRNIARRYISLAGQSDAPHRLWLNAARVYPPLICRYEFWRMGWRRGSQRVALEAACPPSS